MPRVYVEIGIHVQSVSKASFFPMSLPSSLPQMREGLSTLFWYWANDLKGPDSTTSYHVVWLSQYDGDGYARIRILWVFTFHTPLHACHLPKNCCERNCLAGCGSMVLKHRQGSAIFFKSILEDFLHVLYLCVLTLLKIWEAVLHEVNPFMSHFPENCSVLWLWAMPLSIYEWTSEFRDKLKDKNSFHLACFLLLDANFLNAMVPRDAFLWAKL